MSAKIILLIAIILPMTTFGRILDIRTPQTLVADSKEVFVGRVQSIKTSDITTGLSYPTWEHATFRWLMTDVEVLEPFKGTQRGQIVHVAMLSLDKNPDNQFMYSPPGMLDPDIGDIFFFCLAPTPLTNVFAAYTTPYDENLSVFALHRTNSASTNFFRDDEKQLPTSDNKGFILIWNLVNEQGEIMPSYADKFRETFSKELATPAPPDNLTYLEWENYTNSGGWVSDVPKGFRGFIEIETKTPQSKTRLWYLTLPAIILPVLWVFYRKKSRFKKPQI
jgi:hypothetical protein